jgi:cytochrome c oxidase subunit 3
MSSVVTWPDADSERDERATLGMWVFLATELLFFGVLFLAYAYGRAAWPRGFAAAGRYTDVVLGTLNTALLLTSSATAAWAVLCAERDASKTRTARLLAATAALGVAFIVVRGIEYRGELREGLFPGEGFRLAGTPGAELFFMLYWVVTGLHAVHLCVGIVLFAALASAVRRSRAWAGARQVDVAALYWHFVDVVWIFLYPLLYLVERHK